VPRRAGPGHLREARGRRELQRCGGLGSGEGGSGDGRGGSSYTEHGQLADVGSGGCESGVSEAGGCGVDDRGCAGGSLDNVDDRGDAGDSGGPDSGHGLCLGACLCARPPGCGNDGDDGDGGEEDEDAAAAASVPPGRWKAVMGVRPTGWAFSRGGRPKLWKQGPVSLLSAPYSEHSSWTELRGCVRALRPRRLVPTVGSETPAKARALVDLFADLMDTRHDRSRIRFYLAGGAAAGVKAAARPPTDAFGGETGVHAAARPPTNALRGETGINAAARPPTNAVWGEAGVKAAARPPTDATGGEGAVRAIFDTVANGSGGREVKAACAATCAAGVCCSDSEGAGQWQERAVPGVCGCAGLHAPPPCSPATPARSIARQSAGVVALPCMEVARKSGHAGMRGASAAGCACGVDDGGSDRGAAGAHGGCNGAGSSGAAGTCVGRAGAKRSSMSNHGGGAAASAGPSGAAEKRPRQGRRGDLSRAVAAVEAEDGFDLSAVDVAEQARLLRGIQAFRSASAPSKAHNRQCSITSFFQPP